MGTVYAERPQSVRYECCVRWETTVCRYGCCVRWETTVCRYGCCVTLRHHSLSGMGAVLAETPQSVRYGCCVSWDTTVCPVWPQCCVSWETTVCPVWVLYAERPQSVGMGAVLRDHSLSGMGAVYAERPQSVGMGAVLAERPQSVRYGCCVSWGTTVCTVWVLCTLRDDSLSGIMGAVLAERPQTFSYGWWEKEFKPWVLNSGEIKRKQLKS